MSIIDDINNLDPSNPGIWPVPVQVVVFVILFAVVVATGWQIDITKQRDEIRGLEQQEKEQLSILEARQKKAANLNVLKQQMKEIEQSFGDMLRQLPNETEVAGLLIDISQTGLAAGLEFKLFEPKGEVLKEFYAELPINISVVGGYHQFGDFVSGIAALPRIVTNHDISITTLEGQDSATPKLTMNTVAKTYRALEGDEGSENENQ